MQLHFFNQLNWHSKDEKNKEWRYAKRQLLTTDGKLKPHGTKLKRNQHELTHSFIIAENRILALSPQGEYCYNERHSRNKIAEDEDGGMWSVKIRYVKNSSQGSLERESAIAKDLDYALDPIYRNGKYYLVASYLGPTLERHLQHFGRFNKPLADIRCCALAQDLLLKIKALHSGQASITETGYKHYDIHLNNITIDKDGELHLIDYGRSSRMLGDPDETPLSKMICDFEQAAEVLAEIFKKSALGITVRHPGLFKVMKPTLNQCDPLQDIKTRIDTLQYILEKNEPTPRRNSNGAAI